MSERSTNAAEGGVRRRGARKRLVALFLVPVLAITGVIAAVAGPAPAAHAAGNGQLDVRIVAVDADTGAPITTAGWGLNGNRIAYQVDYSCSIETCENTKVALDPTQLDPNLNYYRLLVQTGFTPPATPATITGSAAAGYTVNLGRVEAGQSGQFTVIYSLASAPGQHLAGRDGQYNGWAVANFPQGFEITQSATITSDTAVAPKTATAGGVVYQTTPVNPGVTQSGPPARVETDTDYTYKVYMTSGCTHSVYNAVWGRVVASNNGLCARDYRVVHQLPPGVALVSAEDNPTVSGTVATGLVLTWNAPTWAARNNAEAGWQSLDGRSGDNAASPRSVTVRFPRQNFAPADRACNYDATSAPWRTTATLTYISMPGVAGEEKTATHTTPTVTVSCVEPFAKAVADRKLSTFDGATRPAADQSFIRVPAPGTPVNEKQWTVTVGNQANVDGVAVITDNTLNLADAPVYRIEASLTGASVAWTATNGTTTLSGTSAAPVDAPAGYRFATAVVTSPPLAGPNQYSNQTARTNFTVTFKYQVGSTAPVGGRRTNTASAVMTYPGYPQLSNVQLSIPSHTIIFAQPFAKGDASKVSSGTLAGGEYRITIPTGAATQPLWTVDVNNRSNVPAVPIVDEPDLRAPGNLPVTTIRLRYHNGSGWAPIGGTVQYTLDNGVNGTVTVPATTGDFAAPAGRSFIAARIVGTPINGRNTTPTREDATIFRVEFVYTVTAGSTPDAVWTNRATTTLTFPDYPELASITNQVSATARLVAPATTFTATVGRLALPGGATSVGPTTNVTFTVGGSTSGVAVNRDITPQYVFVAPVGWNITPGSASFPAGSVPAGVSFTYRDVTIGGVVRQSVVASWPAGAVFGENRALPTMSVIARVGPGMPAGTVSRADAYIGNTAAPLPNDIFTTPFTDAPDLDADGNLTERFATANNVNTSTTVGRIPGMQVTKEICLPDAAAADGCEWISDSSSRVGVAPNTTSIRYRLTVTNVGNADLTDVVGYDILPYPGDTGTSDGTGSTPRGSTIREVVDGVSDVSAGLQLTYSDAEQPCRPEVDPTVPGCVNDWQSDPAGAQAIRLSRPGVLAPGASVSMQYTAAVQGNPGNSAVGCNSLAVRATGLSAISEPAAVCAAIEETDLRVVAGAPQLQVGRPGVLPYTVTNLGGAQSTTGRVDVAIPAGVTATSLTFGGWTCTAVDAGGAPLFGSAPGPATLTCRPAQPLLLNQPRALNVPVVPDADEFESSAEVTGRVFDGNLANNEATMDVTAFAEAGDIDVTKTDSRDVARPGDLLTYTITVHNPLLFETITGATLTDTLPRGTEFVSATGSGALNGNDVRWTLPALAGDASVTRTVTVRVLTTVFTDELTNLATVTAPDPANAAATISGTGTDVDAVVTDPELTLTKSSTGATYAAVGDVITYTFAAENTGDVTLHIVSVTDPKPGMSALTFSWPGEPGILAPGQTVTATATYTVTQADLDATDVANTATARALAPDNDEVTDADTHEVASTAVPSIALDKTSSGVPVAAGDRVDYSFTLTNDGPLTLTGVSLTDQLPGLSDIEITWPDVAGQLSPGQTVTGTATYTATQSDVNAGRIVNTAVVTARTIAGVEVTDADTETILIERTSIIAHTKDGVFTGGTDAAEGETIEYTFTATNDGNTTLTGVVIDDPLPGLSGISYDWPDAEGTLLPGESVTATATYQLTQADVDAAQVLNTATVSATAPTGGISREASEAVDLASTPVLTLDKVAAGTVDAAEDVVTYTFVATNDGTLTLTGVVIADLMPGLSGLTYAWPGQEGVLAPGDAVTATATYAATQGDVDAGGIVNTATATGRTLAGADVSGEDTESLEIERVSAVTFDKAGVFTGGADAAEGESIEYTFTVTNEGNTTVSDVVVNDPLPGLSAISYAWPGAIGVLAPGDSVVATATYAITQADVDAGEVLNTATVTGLDPQGAQLGESAEDTVEFSSTASLVLDKSASGTVTQARDVVTYTFTLTNDGTLTLEDVGLDDPMPGLSTPVFGDWPGEEGTLAPGQSVIATATYAARQDDIDAGEIVNTASADGTTLAGAATTDDATETVLIERTPAVVLDKDATYGEGQDGHVGDELHYEFTASNTGNTTLTEVTITDPLPGLSDLAFTWPGTPGTLLPGQSVTATATYVITQADIDGLVGVTNTAAVTTVSPGGANPTADDTVTTPTPAETGIQLDKSADLSAAEPPRAGDLLEYRFAVANLGILTLRDVWITDPMPGLSALEYDWPGAPGVVPAGATVIATATYRLTQAEIDAGRVVNAASVDGRTPAGATVADDDTETTVLRAVPSVQLDKTGQMAEGAWETGDTATFGFMVRNTGNVTLRDISVEDPMAGLSPLAYTWPGEVGVLAPGQTATATATYRLTAADAERGTLTNAATVVSDRAESAQDEVTLVAPAPPANDLADYLARTGGGVGIVPLVAAAILLGGLLLVLVARRRRSEG